MKEIWDQKEEFWLDNCVGKDDGVLLIFVCDLAVSSLNL